MASSMSPDLIPDYVVETYGNGLKLPNLTAWQEVKSLLIHAVRIARTCEPLQEEIDGPATDTLATAVLFDPAPKILPAIAGWRLVVVDRTAEAIEALPIVAWQVDAAGDLVPLARIPSEQGPYGIDLFGGYEERMIGLLAPGETMEGAGWADAAREMADACREAEELDNARQSEGATA